jgi:hypothetical protein
MKRFSSAAAVFIMFLLVSAAIYGQDYRVRNFKVSSNGLISIDNTYGDITVKSWDKNEVAVKYEQEPGSDEESFVIKTSGSQVKIKSYGYNANGIEVTIPKKFNVELETGAGDVKVTGELSGKISGTTAGGDIKLGRLYGTIEFLTSGGDITAEDLKGEIKILTYGGDLKITNAEGTGSLTTSGGDIRINNISKDIKISTAGGNINVSSVNGQTKLSTGGGDITIGYLNGSADIKTGGGNIKTTGGKAVVTASTGAGNLLMYKIDGSVKAASGSGDVILEMVNITQDSYVKTNNGTIRLFLPDNAKVTVEVKVRGFGKHYSYDDSDFIITDLKPTGKNVSRNSDNIMGTYSFNGGGRKIYLDTVNGDIEIKRLVR